MLAVKIEGVKEMNMFDFDGYTSEYLFPDESNRIMKYTSIILQLSGLK